MKLTEEHTKISSVSAFNLQDLQVLHGKKTDVVCIKLMAL